MRKTFLHTLRDETVRIEVGPAAHADLAVESLDLSTRAASPSGTANLLSMHEVVLVRDVAPAMEDCAA